MEDATRMTPLPNASKMVPGFTRGNSIDFLVGQGIFRARTHRNMALTTLAEKTKMPCAFLGQVEAGKARPTPDQLILLSTELGFTLVQLLSQKNATVEHIY